MKITYDNIGDILYLEFVESYAEQESDMVSDTVVVRTNPHNGRVESFEFLFFSEVLRRGEPFDLPIGPDLVPDWNTIAAITREHETRKPQAS